MGTIIHSLLRSLLWRNVIVFGIYLLAFIIIRVGANFYIPPIGVLALIAVCLSLWANAPLFRSGQRLAAVLTSLILVPLVSIPACFVALPIADEIATADYRQNGFEMVRGCNGAAANMAFAQLHEIDQYEEWLKDTPHTNVLIDLKRVRTIAEEQHRVLNGDCRERGHRENHPWKTNWAEIKQTLAAAEKAVAEQ